MASPSDSTCPAPEKRGLNHVEAPSYVGVGVTKFDELVVDGRMPPPKRIDGRKVWDRRRLDLAFDALPDDGPGAEAALRRGICGMT